MSSPVILFILFLVGALVAVGSGIAINSAPLIAVGVIFAVIGAVLAVRNRRMR